ncbi:hypothetical protein [Nocardioides silvaticus]|uniref:hypothetical protein n=1 Tax=Nocardioides silvaticus TaxID=2201891 RepID=UPI0011B24E86|nr:hypothetical protein [Nocardioides silvaticus]
MISGRYDDDAHRTHVLVETEGREIRFDVVDIPDDTYGYSRADRELVAAGAPAYASQPDGRVGLWARPGSYRWLVERFAEAGVGDAEASRVLAAVRSGMGSKEFRFVYKRTA